MGPSQVFRAKFVEALREAYGRDKLIFSGATADLRNPNRFNTLVDSLFRQKWVVYAKPAFGGPTQVLRYQQRKMTLRATEFLRRFSQHILPRNSCASASSDIWPMTTDRNCCHWPGGFSAAICRQLPPARSGSRNAPVGDVRNALGTLPGPLTCPCARSPKCLDRRQRHSSGCRAGRCLSVDQGFAPHPEDLPELPFAPGDPNPHSQYLEITLAAPYLGPPHQRLPSSRPYRNCFGPYRSSRPDIYRRGSPDRALTTSGEAPPPRHRKQCSGQSQRWRTN
jgi:hypothetical protein